MGPDCVRNEENTTKLEGRFLSIGGKITLINSVLNNLPLYFFSFYKAPREILKSLVAI